MVLGSTFPCDMRHHWVMPSSLRHKPKSICLRMLSVGVFRSRRSEPFPLGVVYSTYICGNREIMRRSLPGTTFCKWEGCAV